MRLSRNIDSMQTTAGDIDRDGDTDILFCVGQPPADPGASNDTRTGTCTLLLNEYRATKEIGFAVDSRVFPRETWPYAVRPLLADYDHDGDDDVLLFPTQRRDLIQILRNDSEGRNVRLQMFDGLPGPQVGPVRKVLEVAAGIDPDLTRNAHTLVVINDQYPVQVLELNREASNYLDVSEDRFGKGQEPLAATGDLFDIDGDGQKDLVLQNKTYGLGLWINTPGRAFRDESFRFSTLEPFPFDALDLIAQDFDRDLGLDMLVVGNGNDPHRLLLQELPTTTPSPTDPMRFRDATLEAGLGVTPEVGAVGVFLHRGECDYGVNLFMGRSRSNERADSSVHFFADNSAARIIRPDKTGRAQAEFRGACLEGGDGDDTLVGHRVSSALNGGPGNDVLQALAGITVMSGGSGKDRFEARGVTIIRLPLDEIDAGDVIDCSGADQVIVDSPLTRKRLIAAGVEFINCFPNAGCFEDLASREPRLGLPLGHTHDDDHSDEDNTPDEFGDCHDVRTVLSVSDLTLDPGLEGMEFGDGLGFAANYGSGYGTCTANEQCYPLELDLCRTGTGSIPFGGQQGKCDPSSGSGQDGPVPEWCHDPFWARYRYEELQQLFQADGRRLVIPITFWLIRSQAATLAGNCTIAGHESPASLSEWADSIAAAMNSGAAFFGRWGVRFDYQFRIHSVASNSNYVVDAENDRCRVDLAPGGDEPNSVGALVDEFELDVFNPGELNIYLSDIGGVSWSSVATVNGTQAISFLLLRGSAGAFLHEMGHGLGLPHPYANNVSASGTNPEDSESRDSWLARAFPDDATDRLFFCSSDAQCDGIDADDGWCAKGPGQLLGFCKNLKKDCANDGDHICDTPWDSFPCFKHVGNNEGAVCTTHDDCQSESSVRGRAYLTQCSGSGYCVKVNCVQNSDCGSGSFCADGTCVIWQPGTDSCCDLNTDIRPGFDHNACFEQRPNGTVVSVPGVGSSTTWPYHDNIMAYHRPRGRPRTATLGQRDQAVCKPAIKQSMGLFCGSPGQQPTVTTLLLAPRCNPREFW
ncbi:MAG: hypothetical protein R3C68_18210 [Myxococcota bacterium]